MQPRSSDVLREREANRSSALGTADASSSGSDRASDLVLARELSSSAASAAATRVMPDDGAHDSATKRRRPALAFTLIAIVLVGACIWFLTQSSSGAEARDTVTPLDARRGGDAKSSHPPSHTADVSGERRNPAADDAPNAGLSGAGH